MNVECDERSLYFYYIQINSFTEIRNVQRKKKLTENSRLRVFQTFDIPCRNQSSSICWKIDCPEFELKSKKFCTYIFNFLFMVGMSYAILRIIMTVMQTLLHRTQNTNHTLESADYIVVFVKDILFRKKISQFLYIYQLFPCMLSFSFKRKHVDTIHQNSHHHSALKL